MRGRQRSRHPTSACSGTRTTIRTVIRSSGAPWRNGKAAHVMPLERVYPVTGTNQLGVDTIEAMV